MRQVKYLDNIVEQDHRAIELPARPILNFKLFRSAGSGLTGLESIPMTCNNRFAADGAHAMFEIFPLAQRRDRAAQARAHCAGIAAQKPGDPMMPTAYRQSRLSSSTKNKSGDALCPELTVNIPFK